MPYRWVWILKNYHLLTFWFIEIVSCIVRSRCLLLRVPMIMMKCLQTYFIIVSVPKKFFRRQKSSTVNCKIVTFYIILDHLWVNMAWNSMKLKKSPSAYVFVNKNCFMHRAITLFASASTYDHDGESNWFILTVIYL